MKLILTVIVALVLPCCARAEACLDSAHAVWAEQPRAHATWNYVDGMRCWRAGWPRRHAIGLTPDIGTSPAPLPRSRPDLELLHRDHYERLSPEQGRALADELLGAR